MSEACSISKFKASKSLQIIFAVDFYSQITNRLFSKLILYFITAVFISGCSYFKRGKSEDLVARTFDKYLYKKDLVDIVPKGTLARDSIRIIQNYVDNWVKQNLVIHQADKNLQKDQKNFEKQLEEYRNSLITFAYEKELVRQKLDTVVNDKQIETYYYQNQSNFQLKNNIVKVLYVKLTPKSPNISMVKNWCQSIRPKDRDLLTQYCQKNAINFYLDDEAWLQFDDLLKEIPIKTYDQESYLKNHHFIEFEDSAFIYLVNIAGFKMRESVSPLGFEKDKIRSIILNQRKMKLVGEMEKNVFEEALKEKDFEIYTSTK